MVEMKNSKTPRLYLCDFGFGIQRYDIATISILEQIGKDDNYEGNGWAVNFDFSSSRIEFLHKLYEFMKR